MKKNIKSIEQYISDELSKTPMIDDSIYEMLPTNIKELVYKFEGRERDVFFTTLISALGQSVVDLKEEYNDKPSHTVLFSLISGDYASGKGKAVVIESFLDKFNDYFNTKNEIDKELNNKQTKISSGFLLPTNNSYSAIFEIIYANQGKGFFFESESDMMSINSKNDWGMPDVVVRKSFHHEKIDKSRVTDNTSKVVKKTLFSIVMTGTPKQNLRYIKSPENGMFSRWINYCFEAESKEFTISRQNEFSYEDYFKEKGQLLVDAHRFYNDREEEVKIFWSEDQRRNYESFFNDILISSLMEYGKDARGLVYRHGEMGYRIMRTLSLFRYLELDNTSNTLIVHDEDFEFTKQIMPIYLSHTFTMLKLLKSNRPIITSTKEDLLNQLNQDFTRDEYTTKYNETNLPRSYKSITRSLDKLIEDNLIVRIQRGIYRKV